MQLTDWIECWEIGCAKAANVAVVLCQGSYLALKQQEQLR